MKLTYVNEKDFKSEEIEFPDEMVNLINEMKEIYLNKKIKLDDISFRDYSLSSGPVLIDKDKKSLKFGINLAKTRSNREIGTNLYIVKITKFEDK
jgi:hypothetical protein